MWLAILLAILLLAPTLLKTVASDWRAIGVRLWDYAKGGYSLASSGNGYIWFAAGALSMAVVFVGARYVPSINIPWPDVVVTPVSGARQITIAYESTNAPASFKGALVGLRSEANTAALKAKGHTLDVIDIDEKDAAGNPTKRVAAYREAFPSLQVPVVILRDAGGKLVHSEPLPTSATTAQIMAIVEAHQ